jgi:transcriptional regulator with XRE-family HTH domain
MRIQVMEHITDTSDVTYPTLLEWRTAARLNQQEAAQILGITQSHYGKIERRAIAARGKLAIRIAVKTGVPIETLVMGA